MARTALLIVAAIAVVYLLVIPLLERVVPRSVLRAYWHAINPLWMPTAGLFPGFCIVETIGRRTGRRHRVPVGGRLSGDTFWFVAANGRKAHYVRNIETEPRVRVKVHGRWRDGIATTCPDDNARRRLLRLNPLNSIFISISGTELLTIRVDLESG